MQVKFHGRPPPDGPDRAAKRRRRPPWVTGNFLIFWPFQAISSQPIAHFNHFWTPLTNFCGPFLQIPHRLDVTTKTKLADGWIEFSGHHSDCWTKVMVLMSSWSVWISIDMWFVNFGRRLVSFPFLGCFG